MVRQFSTQDMAKAWVSERGGLLLQHFIACDNWLQLSLISCQEAHAISSIYINDARFATRHEQQNYLAYRLISLSLRHPFPFRCLSRSYYKWESDSRPIVCWRLGSLFPWWSTTEESTLIGRIYLRQHGHFSFCSEEFGCSSSL